MTPENIVKFKTGLGLIASLDYNGFVEVSEAVKDSAFIDHHENRTIFRFRLPTIILNAFEAKFDLEDFIGNLFPECEFTGASTNISGEMLTVKLWYEAPSEVSPTVETQKHDEAPF